VSYNVVELGDLVSPAKLERAGSDVYEVLSMTRHGGLVPQRTVFKKEISSRDVSKYKVVRPNQLVVGIHIDEGALGISLDQELSGIVSPAYTLWDINCLSKTSPKYLHRFIRSPQAIAYFISNYRQTAERRGKITKEQFLALKIPLPPPHRGSRLPAFVRGGAAARDEQACTSTVHSRRNLWPARFGKGWLSNVL
jgi:type I restriction enzyme S subunit